MEVVVGIKRYGFIVKGPGYDPAMHRCVLENPSFRTEIVCVSSVHEAAEVARAFAQAGVEVIELCGGFDESGTNEVIASLNSDVPVGHVVFSKEESSKLERLLSQDGDAGV
jgi:hypothetical protein